MAEVTGSQTAHNFPCVPCSKEDKGVESTRYCEECKLYLCQKCVDQHQRFPTLTAHSLSDTSALVPADRVHVVQLSSDKQRHEITSICCVTRGNKRYTVTSLWHSKKLVVLDELFKSVDETYCSQKPYGMCELQRKRCLAVTARDGTDLYLVEVQDDGSFNMNQSLQVPKSCRGITSFNDTFSDGLVIANGGVCGIDSTKGTIQVYSLATDIQKVREFPAVIHNKDLISRNVVVNRSEERVYFTAPNVGVLVMDTDGKINIFVDTSKNPLLAGARGLCIDDNDDLYIAGKESNNVVKYKADGSLVGEIVNQSHGIQQPISLCFDVVRRYLLIGCTKDVAVDLIYVEL